MEVLKSAFGAYQTNCYILRLNQAEIIIDPGDGAFEWIYKTCKNPVAILNTHGHWDHTYDNHKVKEFYKIPLYIPKDDAFMLHLEDTNFCEPDFLVEPESEFKIAQANVKFMHFPGHTPGCSMIQINNIIFSGDFLFHNSIGRYDLAYSSRTDMIESIKKCLKIDRNFIIYPGHGQYSNLLKEKRNLQKMLEHI